MNSCALIGNLVSDPVLRTTQSGLPVCSFTLAVQRRFKNNDGEYEADFIDCVAWRQTAEFVQRYFSKGSKLALTGSIQTRNYTTQDGSKRHVTEVLVDNVEFVTPRSDAENVHSQANAGAARPQQQTAAQTQNYSQPSSYEDDDELPF